MKFLKAEKGRFAFRIQREEKQLLFRILELYPLVPSSHHQLSRSEERPDDQRLLEEALAAERVQHREQLAKWRKTRAGLCRKSPKGRLSLKAAEFEWLLQVLNDVRIGSWVALGSPDGPAEYLAVLNERTARHFWAMETAARFQMVLLAATTGGA